MTTLNEPDVHVLFPSDMNKLPVPEDPEHRVYNAGRSKPFVVLPRGWRVGQSWRDSSGNIYHELVPYQELGGTDTLTDEAWAAE